MSVDEDSICPSNASEISSSTLLPARRKAVESLDFLEDVSSQPESTFNILARVVMASVAVDDNAKSGCVISQSRELVGTSRWTVDLWRRACVALARLGRYADLWPNLARSSKSPGSNSPQDAVKEILNEFTNSKNATKSGPEGFNFKGSFGAQLAMPFVSPKSFEEVYRKFAVACIFFQSCSGAKRASLFISLELADFYRDAGEYQMAESLYHRATKIFMEESWTELATYSLLQQAFCQQVQWRTETVDTIEASVFSRYVQTALILSITPAKYLHHCYDLLKRRGSYFDNLFGESATFDAIEPETILPPWWPGDWWQHTLETVAEHFERTAPTAMPTEALSLQRMLPPLTAHSLRPLFHLVCLDLEEANPYTHCQVLRLHLRLIGVKPMLLRICVGAQSTTAKDWNQAPLSPKPREKRRGEHMRVFNVDLSSEAPLVGKISSISDVSSSKDVNDSGSANDRATPPSPSVTSSPSSSFFNSSVSKESVMQRLFRRASAGRPSRGLLKKSSTNASAVNGQLSDGKLLKRPTSIGFVGYRGRLNTLDKTNLLPSDSLLDGLTLSSDHIRFLPSADATPDNTSITGDSVFSNSKNVRQHRRGLSLSDLSGLMQHLRWSRDEISSRIGKTSPDTSNIDGPTATQESNSISKCGTFFYPRCCSTNLLRCKMPQSAQSPVDSEGDVLTFQPGDNYLLMETAHYGFHLPREILIFLYNDAQQAAENHPSFIFSSPIYAEQCGSTWCNEALLERLLPRIEQVEALHLNKAHSVDNASKRVSAMVVKGLCQPMLFTVRIGALCIEKPEAASIRLERSVVPDSEAVAALGQRYTIERVEGNGVDTASKWSDLGKLVVSPDETAPDASALFYTPDTRLCLQRSFLLWPKENEKIDIILPTGRPYPINLTPVGGLVFKPKASSFLKKHYLVQVQVLTLDATWPVLGCVNLDEGKAEEDGKGEGQGVNGPSPLNPFYHQERIAFKLSKPELALTPLGNHAAPQPPAPTLGGVPPVPAPQRSISVVEVAPPSPATFATFATAAAAMDHLPDQRELGNSVFFKSRAQEQTPGGSADDDNGPKQIRLFDSQNPIQLLEPPNFEAIVSYGHPLTVSWSVQSSYLDSLQRNVQKSDKIAVSAEFSFLIGSNFNEVRSRIRYQCTISTNMEKSTQQNGFAGIFTRSS